MEKKIKKVANIIEEPRLGGPQLRLLSISSALQGKIDVTAILPLKNSKEFQLRCDEFKVKYLLSPITTIQRKWITIFKYLILFPYEIIKLARLLKKHNFDLVHVSGGSSQYKGLLAAKLVGIKVIWEMNDSFAPYIIRFIFYFFYKLADSFIYGSYNTKKYYEKITFKKKSFLIQSPVNTHYFNPKLNYSTERIIKKKIVIGTVANINPGKDLITFLKVVKKLAKHKNKIFFIIIGSIYESQKKYYKILISLIKTYKIKNIKFFNFQKDVRSLLRNIDIYVCCSKYESSPLSVWEAMSMEKAIVSTNVGDINKFVNDGINGFVVNVGDYSSMADRISKLISQPKLRRKFGKYSRQIAIKKLDLKICCNQHIKMYKKVINSI